MYQSSKSVKLHMNDSVVLKIIEMEQVGKCCSDSFVQGLITEMFKVACLNRCVIRGYSYEKNHCSVSRHLVSIKVDFLCC